MIRKIICPFHEEDTPSMAIYPDGYAHCFGCKIRVPVSKLGIKSEEVFTGRPKYVENVEQSLERIKAYPKRVVRGLEFHCDDVGFFILWPNHPHYKRRRFEDAKGEPKYKGPSGVPTPLFVARREITDTLVVVEGELNALSIASCTSGFDVVSPGASGDFYGSRLASDKALYRLYKNILILVDKDEAGIIAGIELKSALLPLVPHVTLKAVDKDANSTLTEYGSHALKEEIKAHLGMSGGMPLDQEPLQTPGEASPQCGPGTGTGGQAPHVRGRSGHGKAGSPLGQVIKLQARSTVHQKS